jgi:hypothetical protein
MCFCSQMCTEVSQELGIYVLKLGKRRRSVARK